MKESQRSLEVAKTRKTGQSKIAGKRSTERKKSHGEWMR
jgi:hypothetical protein